MTDLMQIVEFGNQTGDDPIRWDGHTDGTWLEIDHIVPLAAGGTNAIENLRSACTPCNKRKSAWVSESDWTARFLKARAAIGREPSEHVAEKVISELLGRPFSMKEVQ